MTPVEALQHHVTGAIERGEKEAIIEQPAKVDLVQVLESYVDRHTLLHVLTALECLCSEKAEHLRHNWQDKRSAQVWDKAGKAIYKAMQTVESYDI